MSDHRKADLKAHQKQMDWGLESESSARINAMIDLARSEPGIPVRPDQLDANPWLLNCPNGTLELRGGRLREHRRGDYITKLCPTPYGPDAACDLWVETLTKIFAGKHDLVAYFQRLCGYSLTGDVREQMLPILWGEGSNGKSVVISTVHHVLGDEYTSAGARELLMSGHFEPHPTFLADLFGKRLVTLLETREDGRLNEALIKQLTGGDAVRARRMKEDFWQFRPTHKIWLATNHRPVVRGTDHGIWRRLRLLPFTVKFWDASKGESGPEDLEADKGLSARLEAEAEGILAWMVRGCLEWQAGGLAEPAEVSEATKTYRDEQDVVAKFKEECLIKTPNVHCRASAAYAAFQAWHKANGIGGEPMSLTLFGRAIAGKGIFKEKKAEGVVYIDTSISHS
jgi:putative DNA primase/helicase